MIRSTAAGLKFLQPVKTALTLPGGKRPERISFQITGAPKEGQRIFVVESPMPPGGGETVLGPSCTEKGWSIFTGRTTGCCLDHVALSPKPLHPDMLELARARREAAFGTKVWPSPERLKSRTTDRSLKFCSTMVATVTSYSRSVF